MSRKRVWLVAMLTAAVLAAAAGVWSWYHDRMERVAIDSLIAELADEGDEAERRARSLPPLPDRPSPDQIMRQSSLLIERMHQTNERTIALQKRVDDAIPTASERHRDRIRDALSSYQFRLGRAQETFDRRAAELREKSGTLRQLDEPNPG